MINTPQHTAPRDRKAFAVTGGERAARGTR
jgi:hypothetical protein